MWSSNIIYTYAEGTTLVCTNKGDNGVRFEGENGKWLFVNREKIEASHPSILKDPLPANAVRLYACDFHEGNWIDCMRSGKPPICPAEVGHRSATVCHLGNIALRMQGSTLEWDPDREEFRNSQRANKMRFREMRAPWSLK